jgi:integrase
LSISRRNDRHGKTRYTVRIEVTEAMSGDRQRVTVGTFGSKREAQAAEAKAITEPDRGTLLASSTTTVGDLLNEWIRIELPQSVRPENRQPYVSIIENHLKPALGHVQARKLSVEQVERLMSDMQARGLSSSLITKARMRLSSALKLGIRWGIVGANVAENAKPPKVSYKQADIWTPGEVQSFLNVARGDSNGPIWWLLVETGARQSEILGLSWQDVDLTKATIRLGRRKVRLLSGSPILKDGGKSAAAGRTVMITPGTVAELNSWLTTWQERKLAGGPDWNPHSLLFTTANGTPLSPNNLRRVFDRLVAEAGVTPITPHAIRACANRERSGTTRTWGT